MNRKIDKPVLEKPIVGGSKDVWGDILNVNIDNTEKFHTQLLSDLETKDAELARLERDKASKSDLPDLVHPIVDNYVESSVKPTINEYIDSTSKPEINSHVESKKQELNSYVNTTNKPELDKYTKAKEGELDTHTGKKKSELDVYEKDKEGQLDSHTNTKKEELNQHTAQKQGQLDENTTAKKGELDSHTTQKKNELNTHEKAKEKELDNYVTTVNKPELDSYTNIKKEEFNSHTKTKESEITQVTETKKQEITAHGASELGKFGQGAKQEADKQIGRVVAEGDVQVQRVKDESNGVIPRIEKLESGKVSKNGDTMTGNIHNDNSGNVEGVMEFTRYGTLAPKKYVGAIQANWFDDVAKFGIARGNNTYLNTNSLKFTLNSNVYDIYHTGYEDDKFSTSSKTVSGAINELNSKKSDLTGSTFTGLVAVKKDTNGEAMVALNSAYGNGDIYSGGSAKGVGFRNRTSGKGIFLSDSGDMIMNSTKVYVKDSQLIYNNTKTTAQYIPHVKTFRIRDTKIQGMIKISFKNGFDSTMMDFVVNIFNYKGASGKVYISGYNYSTDRIWAYNDSNMIYNDNSIERAVYFGEENDIPVIYIGNKNETYDYPMVTIGEMGIISWFDSRNFLDNIDIEIVNDFNSDFIKRATQKTLTLNNKSIIDNLLSTDTDKPLSANQGKRLSDEKLDKSSVINDLTTGGTDKVLSAEQGKVLKSLLDSVSGDSSGGLVKDSKSYSKILHTGDLTPNGKDITVGKKLYFPALFLDGVRIDESEFDVNHAGGVITLKQPYANYQVTWVIVDMLPNHIKFAYPTLNMLKADEGIKKLINLGDVIEILGESDADDGGHRLVKCENSSKLNGVDIGSGRFLNEIPNTRMDSKQDKVDNRLQTHNKEIVKSIDEVKGHFGYQYGTFPLSKANRHECFYHGGTNKVYICIKGYSGESISNPNSNFEELSFSKHVYDNGFELVRVNPKLWYKKYYNGMLEIFGKTTSSEMKDTYTINFPINFIDTNYMIVHQYIGTVPLYSVAVVDSMYVDHCVVKLSDAAGNLGSYYICGMWK